LVHPDGFVVCSRCGSGRVVQKEEEAPEVARQ